MSTIVIREQDLTLKVAPYSPVGVMNEGDLDPANMSSGSATAGQVPVADGAGNVSWSDESGLGDVTGPASATDGRVAVFSGATGKVIKEPVAAVDFNAQDIANVGSVAGHVATTRQIIDGTGISGGGDLSADRTLSVNQSALDPANMSSGSAADGYVVTADGLGGVAWEAAGGGGGGDVTGPGSSTDHALPRWDGTGGDTLLDSGVTLSDAGAMVFPTGGSISKPGTGVNSEAFGNGATAGSDRAVAVGYNASAPGNYATIIGAGSTGVSGDGATSVGFSCDAGINAVCIGRESEAWEAGSIVIGFRSYVRTPTSGDSWGAIAIGSEAEVGDSGNAGSDGAIAFGYYATVGYSCKDSIGIGYNASVGNGSAECVAVGPGAAITSGADDAVAIGKLASVAASGGVAIGDTADVDGANAIAIGINSESIPNYGIALGDTASNKSGAADSIAIGRSATNWTNINNAISIGRLSECANSGDYAIAFGDNTAGKHANAIALGRNAETTATSRCTIGTIGGSYDQQLQFGRGLGCFGVTPPSSQPTKISDPTDLPSCITAITAIIDVLEGAGLSAAT